MMLLGPQNRQVGMLLHACASTSARKLMDQSVTGPSGVSAQSISVTLFSETILFPCPSHRFFQALSKLSGFDLKVAGTRHVVKLCLARPLGGPLGDRDQITGLHRRVDDIMNQTLTGFRHISRFGEQNL